MVCIEPKGRKLLIDFLLTYLKYNPELIGPLPHFRLPSKTLLLTEAQQIISYLNIPGECGLTLESLRSMIDGDDLEVSWILMENYYGLLREKFQSNDSSVMISNLHSIQCIYQVSDIFQALPTIEQVFTNGLFCDMLLDPDLTTIQASLSTSKIMMFPFFTFQISNFYWQ